MASKEELRRKAEEASKERKVRNSTEPGFRERETLLDELIKEHEEKGKKPGEPVTIEDLHSVKAKREARAREHRAQRDDRGT